MAEGDAVGAFGTAARFAGAGGRPSETATEETTGKQATTK
jgi:hypothetical protein